MILYFSATGNGKYISELKIVDILFFLPAMGQRLVRLAAWRRILWRIMGRSSMRIIV